jgi:hypothetical protein
MDQRKPRGRKSGVAVLRVEEAGEFNFSSFAVLLALLAGRQRGPERRRTVAAMATA